MKLSDLIESTRRDIFGQLDRIPIYTTPDTHEEIIIKLSRHLDDERDSGEARGDHAKPSEIKKHLRTGLKKLIDQLGTDKLVSDDRNARNQIGIKFKLKAKQRIKNRSGRTVKLDLYTTLIGALYRYQDTLYFKVITLLKPTRDKFEPIKARYSVVL